jgi:hypothetical protein
MNETPTKAINGSKEYKAGLLPDASSIVSIRPLYQRVPW